MSCKRLQARPAEPVPASHGVVPRLLTIKQTAAYLNSTVWSVRNLIWSDAVQAIRIGRRFLIDRKELDAYIDAQLVLPAGGTR